MHRLADLARGLDVLREGPDVKAGASTVAAAAGSDTIVASAGADTQSAGMGVADTQPAGAGSDTQAAGAAKPTAKRDWRDDRIAQLTARLNANKTSAPATPAAPAVQPDPTADFNRRVAEAASRQAAVIAANQTFNDRCNSVVEAGRETFGAEEFNASVAGLLALVNTKDEAEMANYTDFLESAIETGAGAGLIFELGRDQTETARLLALPPKKRAIELAKRATTLAPVSEPSRAPTPIRPIDARGARHEEIRPSDPTRADDLPIEDWMARRNAEVKARAGGSR